MGSFQVSSKGRRDRPGHRGTDNDGPLHARCLLTRRLIGYRGAALPESRARRRRLLQGHYDTPAGLGQWKLERTPLAASRASPRRGPSRFGVERGPGTAAPLAGWLVHSRGVDKSQQPHRGVHRAMLGSLRGGGSGRVRARARHDAVAGQCSDGPGRLCHPSTSLRAGPALENERVRKKA
jgi:hypothetical protein